MKKTDVLILGGGISSLSAAYHLEQRGIRCLVLEKNPTYGGLCDNFTVAGFRFDRFVHFSFGDIAKEVEEVLYKGAGEVIRHKSNPYNIYNRVWIKHPAQNNLYPLSVGEKKLIIDDFRKRSAYDPEKIGNYEEWLRCQFGDYFAEHFPIPYTRKYWMSEARDLGIKWTGGRFYQPSVEEVIQGSMTPDTPTTYYSKEMCYPAKGGFRSFLTEMAAHVNIECNREVIAIDPKNRIVRTPTEGYYYKHLISSIPLTEMPRLIPDMPDAVIEAAKKLRATSGYLVSVGLKGTGVPPYLWWYIYDEDILPVRGYSPYLKSEENCPEGCSSLQLEIYCKEGAYDTDTLKERSVGKLVEMGVINEADILFVDIRFEHYGNIIFDHNVYEARQTVKDYLTSQGIDLIGRFGEWEYWWTDQCFLSGKRCAQKLMDSIKS